MRPLNQLTTAILASRGALVSPLEPDGLEGLAPEAVQCALDVPDWFRVGFDTQVPDGARRVTIESDWGERLESLLANSGRRLTGALDLAAERFPSEGERLLAHAVTLDNATYRLAGVDRASAVYLWLSFRCTATSDEKGGVASNPAGLAAGAAAAIAAVEAEGDAGAPSGLEPGFAQTGCVVLRGVPGRSAGPRALRCAAASALSGLPDSLSRLRQAVVPRLPSRRLSALRVERTVISLTGNSGRSHLLSRYPTAASRTAREAARPPFRAKNDLNQEIGRAASRAV